MRALRRTSITESMTIRGRTRRTATATVAAFACWMLAPSSMARTTSPQESTSETTAADSPLAALQSTSPKDVRSRIEEVQKALSDLRDGKSEEQARIETLESRLQVLRKIQDDLTQTASFLARTKAAKAVRAGLDARLQAIRTKDSTPKIPETATQAELGDKVRTLTQAIEDTNAQNEAAVSSIDFRLRRREELRELESMNLQALATIDTNAGLSPVDRRLRLERLQVEQKLVDAERSMFKATDPNLTLAHEVLTLESADLRTRLVAWQDAMNRRIKASAKKLATTADAAADNASHPIVRAQAEQNRQLAQRLEEIHVDEGPTMKRLAAARLELEDVRRQRLLDESRVTRDSSPEAVSQMRERFAGFPDVARISVDIASEQKLVQMARDQLDFLETLSWLSDASQSASQAIASDESIDDTDREKSEASLEELFRVRQNQLVSPLRSALNERIDVLSQLVALQQSVIAEIDRYQRQVMDRTIWVRDPSATTWTNYRVAGKQFTELFSPSAWRDAVGILLNRSDQRPFILALGIIPPIVWLAFLRPVRRRITLAGDRVSKQSTDSLGETMLVSMFTLFAGLAWAAPAWSVSQLLADTYNSTQLVACIHASVVRLVTYLFVAGALWSILTSGGLAEKHFNLSSEVVHKARIAVLVGLAMIPFAFLASLCDPDALDLIPAGRILFTPVPLLFALMAWLLFHPDRGLLGHTENPSNRVAHAWMWGFLITLVCLLVLITAAANLGWYRLVLNFHRSLVQSTLLIWAVLLSREFLLRVLRARHRGATWTLRRQEHLGEDVTEQTEELERLETRTLRSIRFGVVAGIVIGLYWIWRTVFPAFAGMDQIVLWSAENDVIGTSDVVSTDSQLIITLGDTMRCLIAVIVTWYTARNLPSLIELLIVDRFAVERGIKYAITQLLQWAMLIGGLIYAASFLNISWSSVQWLAAGLTVGLGFGLQEIFANFISGLIILFERPIRLGDVVTVGGTNGRISRIRMRSTTITDWDRKELVVPNKKFVTEEIVNWSIGEACIRVVLPVGVSYGENPEKVVEILRTIGDADPEVLSDPPPSVMFKSFGDSSLDFELRLYLPSTENMSDIRTRVNVAIKREFDAAGISIPFPQRDIRVEMVRPDAPDSGPSMPMSPRPDDSVADADDDA